jgi:hypothetical protein
MSPSKYEVDSSISSDGFFVSRYFLQSSKFGLVSLPGAKSVFLFLMALMIKCFFEPI